MFDSCTIRTNETNDIRRYSWLQIRDNCPNIIDMIPSYISKAKSSKVKSILFFYLNEALFEFQLQLRVDSVPDDPNSRYSCSFGLSSVIGEDEENYKDKFIYKSNAMKYENYIECYSPPSRTLSNIDYGRI